MRVRPRFAWGISVFAFAVLFMAFLLLVSRLLYWVVGTGIEGLDSRFVSLIGVLFCWVLWRLH